MIRVRWLGLALPVLGRQLRHVEHRAPAVAGEAHAPAIRRVAPAQGGPPSGFGRTRDAFQPQDPGLTRLARAPTDRGLERASPTRMAGSAGIIESYLGRPEEPRALHTCTRLERHSRRSELDCA
jgi:hypothetical protein